MRRYFQTLSIGGAQRPASTNSVHVREVIAHLLVSPLRVHIVGNYFFHRLFSTLGILITRFGCYEKP